MNATACSDFEAEGTAARYAAGALPPPVEEEFERHLIGCAACQESVRLAAGARSALAAMPMPRPWRLGRFGAIGAVAMAAAAVLAIAFVGPLDRRELRQLGAVGTMPGYESIEVRASTDAADTLFVRGMRLYREGRYDEALPALAEARARGADSTATSFFIGVLELRAGRADAAVGALTLALRRASPYEAEAHYYLAKGWLQLARTDSAAAHLTQAARAESPVAAEARALAESLEVRQR